MQFSNVARIIEHQISESYYNDFSKTIEESPIGTVVLTTLAAVIAKTAFQFASPILPKQFRANFISCSDATIYSSIFCIVQSASTSIKNQSERSEIQMDKLDKSK